MRARRDWSKAFDEWTNKNINFILYQKQWSYAQMKWFIATWISCILSYCPFDPENIYFSKTCVFELVILPGLTPPSDIKGHESIVPQTWNSSSTIFWILTNLMLNIGSLKNIKVSIEKQHWDSPSSFPIIGVTHLFHPFFEITILSSKKQHFRQRLLIFISNWISITYMDLFGVYFWNQEKCFHLGKLRAQKKRIFT